MANWGNTKISGSMKVVSHERVEDTDPQTYCNRGQHFSEQGKFMEAEKEYLKAVQFSGKNDWYVEKLLRFYYSTERKDFEGKANKIYYSWWWRQGENQLLVYIMVGALCFIISNLGFQEELFSVGLGMLPLLYGTCYPFIHHKKWFINDIRKKYIGMVIKWFGLVFLGMFCIVIIIEGDLTRWSNFGGESLNKMFGIGGAIGCLVLFNKAVTVLQDGVNHWKKISRREFGAKALKMIRIAGTLILIVLEVQMFGGWSPL